MTAATLSMEAWTTIGIACSAHSPSRFLRLYPRGARNVLTVPEIYMRRQAARSMSACVAGGAGTAGGWPIGAGGQAAGSCALLLG